MARCRTVFASGRRGWGRPRIRPSRSEVSGIDLLIIALAAAWLAGFGAAAARLAVRRRRRPQTWAVFGAILGPAALAILQVAPPGRCWSCAAPTQGWLTLCPWCGEDVRGAARERPPEPIHLHGLLTVIDGSAPRAPVRDPSTRSAPGRASNPRGATVRQTRGSGARTLVDAGSGAGERPIDAPALPRIAEPVERAPATAATASVAPTADPVNRLRSRLGRSLQSLATAEAELVPLAVAEPLNVVVASAIYVTGTRGLQPGSRYGIALVGHELRILGPVDVDPGAVAIVHSLRGVDATGLQGRLIITAGQGRRDRLALVFMSVAGGSAEGVADTIVTAAAGLGADSR